MIVNEEFKNAIKINHSLPFFQRRIINEMKKWFGILGDRMKYGYTRVSVVHQDLEGQLQALMDENCERIFQDKLAEANRDRPSLQQLLQEIETGDILVVTKLDQFARSAMDGIETIKKLFQQGIAVHVLNMGLVEDTPTGRLIFNVMLAFAELERNMILERTQEGKALAKKNPDFREGRPKVYSNKQMEHAIKLKETHTYRQVEDMTGISKSTLIRARHRKGLMR